ncbi:hypothetical protein TNCV_822751 [Trichonephila clavipes]|nr:hypothetical protein TNCV_822751 [Trichonephila clavipes]
MSAYEPNSRHLLEVLIFCLNMRKSAAEAHRILLKYLCIRKIWRKNKTALEPQNVLPTLKYGGGNVMVWGCVAHNGAGNLAFIDNKINALAYIDVL